MALWSLTRVIWGAATLVVYKYDIELLQDSNTPMWSFFVLLLLFVVCEILPIVALLDYSYLSIVGLELVEIRSIDNGTGDGDSVTTINTSGILPEFGSIAGNRVDHRSIPSVSGGDLLLPRTPPRSSSGRRGVRWQDEPSAASTDPLLDPSPAVSGDD
jgi:hypothetical protein